MSTVAVNQSDVLDAETELWKALPVEAWKNSVLNADSVFHDLYVDTRRRIVEACKTHKYDVIIEVGCGTGEVISHLEEVSHIPRIGVDINPSFVEHCRSTYDQPNLEFHVGDATKIVEWWQSSGYNKVYKAPFLVCPNNTIMIMPREIRDEVIHNMRAIASTEGRCLITYWNGRMFAHGVMGYYKKNSDLCGEFDLSPKHVDWEAGSIETTTSYKSEWLKSEDIKVWMSSILIDVDIIPPETKITPESDHLAEYGMGVYMWLNGTGVENDAVSSARDYYDSKDAQTFYTTVWGTNNTHVGRYDLVEADANYSNLSVLEKIRKAQLFHEDAIMNKIGKYYDGTKVRCLDMGCGYGGLLRTLADEGLLWSGTGVDISGGMIDAARANTERDASEKVKNTIEFLRESYMNTSVNDDSMDLCVSMDAFLHVGPDQHDAILKEAWRVLRPGGRLIFSDIVARPDAPAEAKQLYERIGLTAFATVPGYFEKAKLYGFGHLKFDDHSENVTSHYDNVLTAFEDLYSRGEIDVGAEFKTKMCVGLEKWRDLAPSCIQWGIISMRKVEHFNDSSDSE